MMNLPKVSQSANTRHLDDPLRRIYALDERITLIDLKEDAVTP